MVCFHNILLTSPVKRREDDEAPNYQLLSPPICTFFCPLFSFSINQQTHPPSHKSQEEEEEEPEKQQSNKKKSKNNQKNKFKQHNLQKVVNLHVFQILLAFFPLNLCPFVNLSLSTTNSKFVQLKFHNISNWVLLLGLHILFFH